MTRGQSRLGLLLLAIAAVLALAAPSVAGASGAPASSGRVTCTGFFNGSAVSVTVPTGQTCYIYGGANVSQSVQVGAGAQLSCDSSTVAQDIQAHGAAGVDISNCQVGHDVILQGLSGQAPYGDSYVCSSTIGHDLQIQNATAGSSPIVVGSLPDCTAQSPGNSVGHDIVLNNDATATTVSSNSAGHDAQCNNNTPATFGGGNTAAHNSTCPTGPVPFRTECAPGSVSCSASATAPDGQAEAYIFTQSPGSGNETIVMSFGGSALPCSTPGTGEPLNFTVTNAGSEKDITYSVLGAAADAAEAAHPGGYICLGSTSSFMTAAGTPAVLGADGLYYGSLPQCTYDSEEVITNTPCLAGAPRYNPPDGEGGESFYSQLLVVTQGDPRASN